MDGTSTFILPNGYNNTKEPADENMLPMSFNLNCGYGCICQDGDFYMQINESTKKDLSCSYGVVDYTLNETEQMSMYSNSYTTLYVHKKEIAEYK